MPARTYLAAPRPKPPVVDPPAPPQPPRPPVQREPRFLDVPRQQSPPSASLPPTLRDIASRLPKDGRQYRYENLVTWAHEATHGVNAEIKNSYREQHGYPPVNGFYCLEGRGVVLDELRTTLRQVAQSVPASLRGSKYHYLIESQDAWNAQPLFIFDEWVAYYNGAVVARELGRDDDVPFPVELGAYALCVVRTAYSDDAAVRAFVRWHWRRSLELGRGDPRAQHFLETLKTASDAGSLRTFCHEYLGPDWLP